MKTPRGLIVCAALSLPWAPQGILAQSAGGAGEPPAEEAPSERPSEESRVLAALTRFVDALVAGDVRAVRELMWVNENSPSQVQMRDLLMQLIAAQRSLEQAARQRYGADGAMLAARFHYALTDEDRKALNEAVIFIDEPMPGPAGSRVFSARVYSETQPTPMRLRRDPDGPWRVVFEPFDGRLNDDLRERRPYPFTRIFLERYQATVRAINETTDRVLSGELTSPRAACTELSTRLITTAQEYENKILEVRRPR